MNPQVELKSDTSNALQSLVFAAKLCYGQEQDFIDEEAQVKLIKKILAARHFSILEHAVLSIYITGVSRNFTHQLVRHRHMSFAQQSFHYTIAENAALPLLKESTPLQLSIMKKAYINAFKMYEILMAEGMTRDEARHVLPSGITTKIICTANLREWVHFASIRSCEVNCLEIKTVAYKVQDILANAFPWLTSYVGPTCWVEGKCYEGKKSCGHPWQKLESPNGN